MEWKKGKFYKGKDEFLWDLYAHLQPGTGMQTRYKRSISGPTNAKRGTASATDRDSSYYHGCDKEAQECEKIFEKIFRPLNGKKN